MNRREFGKLAIGALAFQSLAGIPVSGLAGGKPGGLPKVPLGMCDHAIRTMRPNADQLIDYAIEHRLDSIILNSFRPLESRDDDYLARIRARAAAHDVGFHVGAGSVSEKSTRFSDRYGNARETLEEGIRVAAALGSPVVTCRIGTIEDRYTEGGIEAHVEAVIALMKSLRSRALDAGVKFAFENHAGDLRSKELLALIEETGPDVCGAILDFGNAIWAMEDPIDAIRTLGPHILTTSVRDVMLWETGDGAMFQWVAVGQGLMDFPLYVDTMAELCPGTPLHVESISNSPRPIPYLTPAFWKGFPGLDASEIVPFLKLVRRGHPLDVLQPADGEDQKSFDIRHQKSELRASLDYLRGLDRVGLKA